MNVQHEVGYPLTPSAAITHQSDAAQPRGKGTVKQLGLPVACVIKPVARLPSDTAGVDVVTVM